MVIPIGSSPADLDPSILSNEIVLDEALDALDPLRHLRGDESLADDGDSQSIVPIQPRSTSNELIRLSFPDRGCSTIIHVVLKVDASPGCGGIAWPAGEVRTSVLALSTFWFALKGQSDHRSSRITWPFAGRGTAQEERSWSWAVGLV